MKRGLSLIAGALAPSLFIAPASASERNGASCPNITEASIEQGVLKCWVTLEYVRASMCPRVDYPNYTQIELAGVDQCKPQGMPLHGKASVDSAMTPLSTAPRFISSRAKAVVTDPIGTLSTLGAVAINPPPASAYERQIGSNSQDKFAARLTVHVWPTGMPVTSTVGHSPSRGVACPAGMATEMLDGMRRLVCIGADVHKAGCDGVNPLNPLSPWTIERRTGRDLCMSTDITGNRVTGQYTIPTNAGYVGAMGNPAQHGWSLDVDRSGYADYWVKNGTIYKYPVAR